MIKIDNIDVIVDGSEYSAKVEIPSQVTTSTPQEETVDLANTPNLFIKVVDPDNTLKIGVNVEAQLTTEEGTYTMICDVVSKNQMYTTLQYAYGMTFEADDSSDDGSSDDPDEPTIGDLGFTIDSNNYDKGGSSFNNNGDNTWTVDLVRSYPHGDFNLSFSDADGHVIFDAANMLNNNQGDPIFDIIIDEPNEYNASATFRTAPSYGSDDQMLGSITAAIGTYKLSGKIRTNVTDATVYLTDAEYNAITNAGQYYTYDGSQYDEENDGVTYKRYTLDLTPWQNAEGNAIITLEVFDPNSLGT